jgi:NADPH-dependent ferric siderophore reductase
MVAAMPERSLGRLERTVARLFTRSAAVAEARSIGDRFRWVALEGAELRGVRWSPGQKVQVAMGDWTYRTYTPLSWDADRGRAELLVFLHGDSPGAAWGRTVAVGDGCVLMGPRGSIDVPAVQAPALLFGDETSVGLAVAMRATLRDVHVILEVGDRLEVERVLDAVGLGEVELVERTEGDTHLQDIEALAAGFRDVQGLVLSGKAPSIQALGRTLRTSLSLSRAQVKTRAYWAPGKRGLD